MTATERRKAMTRMLRGITVFAAMAVLGVSPAMADDKVFHPTGICHGENPDDRANMWQTTFGVYNTGTSEITVICGFIRDNTLNTNGLKGFKVRVNVPTTGGSVSCVLGSLNTNGEQLQAWQIGTTTSGFRTLDWGTALNLSVAGGTYVMWCGLSPNASIRSIVMSEY
jgi:hypothetical protein